MKKARIGVNQGAIKDTFNPFHIEINASEQRDISESTILSKVQGTCNWEDCFGAKITFATPQS